MALAWLLCAWACQPREGRVRIEGVVADGAGRPVRISQSIDSKWVALDSTKTRSDGHFDFTLYLNAPSFLIVELAMEGEPILLLVEPGEHVRIETRSGAFAHGYRVVGSPGSALLGQLNARLTHTVSAIDSLGRLFHALRDSAHLYPARQRLDSAYAATIARHQAYTAHFVRANRYSLAAVVALHQRYDAHRSVLNLHEDLPLFELIDSTLHPLYPHNALVANLRANIKRTRQQEEWQALRGQMLTVGSPIPIQRWPLHPAGSVTGWDAQVELILVDMWASWCSSCQQHNAQLLEVYRRFHPKGLEILQVVVDELAHPQDMAFDTVPWLRVADGRGLESPMLDTLRVSVVPSNYLMDRHGMVKAVNLTPQQLSRLLEEELR